MANSICRNLFKIGWSCWKFEDCCTSFTRYLAIEKLPPFFPPHPPPPLTLYNWNQSSSLIYSMSVQYHPCLKSFASMSTAAPGSPRRLSRDFFRDRNVSSICNKRKTLARPRRPTPTVSTPFKIAQCDKEYHIGCLKDNNICELKDLPNGDWFCSNDCKRIGTALKELDLREPEPLPYLISYLIKKKCEEKGLHMTANTDLGWKIIHGTPSDAKKPILSRKDPSILEVVDEEACGCGRAPNGRQEGCLVHEKVFSVHLHLDASSRQARQCVSRVHHSSISVPCTRAVPWDLCH